MPNERRLLLFLVVAAAGLYLIFILRTSFEVEGQPFFTLVDDAMVSMRYARHLAQGHGLVWNIGEPPIQGFTNPGWTLLLALVHLFPIPLSHISLAVMITAGIILLANIVVVHQAVRVMFPTATIAPMIAATVVAFYFPFVYWTLRGLEVGALVLTMSLALIFTVRLARDDDPHALVGLILTLCLSILIRMDAIIQVGILLAYLLIRKPRSAVWPITACILFSVFLLFFQKTYFGDFLPNTYYLKIVGTSIAERVRLGIIVFIKFASRDSLMLLFVVVLGLLGYKTLRSHEAAVLLSLFFVQIAYSTWVGGDYAEEIVQSANRFIAQGMSFLIIIFSLTVEQVLKTGIQTKPVLGFVLGLGSVIVMSSEPWALWALTNAPMLESDIQRVRTGIHIRENTDPAAVIAVHAAGQIPYFSERTSIDLLGKSDRFIARSLPVAIFVPGHNKWNYEYSIGTLQPDVVADRFNKLRAYIDNNPDYRRLHSGIYVRKDSTLVNVDGLAGEYP